MEGLTCEVPQYQSSAATPFTTRSLPLGEPIPPNEPHALSVSLPTFECITAAIAGEEWSAGKMQTAYPRFDIHNFVQDLTAAVRSRLQFSTELDCMIFPAKDAARRFMATMKSSDSTLPVYNIRFFLLSGLNAPETERWTSFYAVLFHKSLELAAAKFWELFGDGISSRHAAFCLARFPFLESEAVDSGPEFKSSPTNFSYNDIVLPAWMDSAINEKKLIKSLLARCVRPTCSNLKLAEEDDIYLYSTGMAAISAIARALVSLAGGAGAVVYGWPYAGTVPCVRRTGYGHFTLLGHGTKEELDQLELSLKLGTKVMVLFCEIPSNPQCHTPDLHRIRDLADRFGFVVVCDDTIATAVNVDIVPYVDVIVSSLSKIVSGACNVMGGSLLVNPNSKHYNMIHTCIRDQFEDLFFPEDAMTLAHNCKDFVDRVRKCNDTAERIASFIAAHPAVSYVNYPTMVSSRPQYERYRRQDGGYGYILSIAFDEPEFAVKFYDNLAVCKGPSVGTNFTLALAYSMVAHADELDWAEAHGVPKYIIRISIGLEEESDLRARIGRALGEAGKLERKPE